MKRVCLILFMCVMVSAASADLLTQPYIAGEFNGWDPGSTPMVETAAGSGIWEYTISGLTADQYQKFKITPGDWSVTAPAADSWYNADGAGEVTITFNTNVMADGWLPEQFRVGVSTDPGSWSLVGDFNGWNNADPAQLMASMGGGIYSITQTFAAGNYLLKPTRTGTWDAIGLDGRSTDAWNYYLELTADTEVMVSVDALAGTMKVDIIPEPCSILLMGLGSLALGLKRRK